MNNIDGKPLWFWWWSNLLLCLVPQPEELFKWRGWTVFWIIRRKSSAFCSIFRSPSSVRRGLRLGLPPVWSCFGSGWLSPRFLKQGRIFFKYPPQTVFGSPLLESKRRCPRRLIGIDSTVLVFSLPIFWADCC